MDRQSVFGPRLVIHRICKPLLASGALVIRDRALTHDVIVQGLRKWGLLPVFEILLTQNRGDHGRRGVLLRQPILTIRLRGCLLSRRVPDSFTRTVVLSDSQVKRVSAYFFSSIASLIYFPN